VKCTRCQHETLVFPLHGVDQGGPIVCPTCAGEIEKSFSYERNCWLARLGFKEKPRGIGPTYLTLELLKDVLMLVHPDKHPPERAELAGRVTAELNVIKPYVPPAPPPAPSVTVKNPSPRGPNEKPLRPGPKPDMKLEAITDKRSTKGDLYKTGTIGNLRDVHRIPADVLLQRPSGEVGGESTQRARAREHQGQAAPR
jgi:hypothetical protein